MRGGAPFCAISYHATEIGSHSSALLIGSKDAHNKRARPGSVRAGRGYADD
jgi:hypothetical protein